MPAHSKLQYSTYENIFAFTFHITLVFNGLC